VSLTTPLKIRTLQRKLYVKAKSEPKCRFYLLYDKVHRADILTHAYALAKANGGAPGVDGETFGRIEARGVEQWLRKLEEELRAGTYRPAPVRRVLIPKPGGGERPLGIPTVRDRVVQTAAKLVIEPIFEADFVPEAYGYRPQRSALDAVQEVHRTLCAGYVDVVDADLSKYFDTIPHSMLMKSVARRISDRRMLRLIRRWLKTPIEERDDHGGKRLTGGKQSKMGTPQGGVISPLLANIYMHRFLKAWHLWGKADEFEARIVNYADDFVILSRGHAAEALEWTRQVMTRIGLTLNETKTCLRHAPTESFDFLGYRFGMRYFRKDGHTYLAAEPSSKSIQRLRKRLRELLHPGNHAPWEAVACHLGRVLNGWRNYFRHGTTFFAYRALERHLVQRVRQFLRRRHKMASRGTTRFSIDWIVAELGVDWLRGPVRVRPTCVST
jgi:RNA-directed DNA polymerase